MKRIWAILTWPFRFLSRLLLWAVPPHFTSPLEDDCVTWDPNTLRVTINFQIGGTLPSGTYLFNVYFQGSGGALKQQNSDYTYASGSPLVIQLQSSELPSACVDLVIMLIRKDSTGKRRIVATQTVRLCPRC